jgi:flagellar biosynthesis/type III secretory pathway protein FliH
LSSVLSRPEMERRAYVIHPPAATGGTGAFYSDEELLRVREEAAQTAAQRTRTDFEEWGRGLEERTAGAAAGLFAVARELRDARRMLLEEAADQVVALAFAVARRVLRREVEADPEAALPIVRELLQRAAAGTEVTVRLSPRDHAILTAHDALPEASGLGGLHFRLDNSISPGGALVETSAGGLDGRLETQLELLEEALRAPREKAA